MSMKKKVVVLTGAGVSAESGIRTFRDSDGLWEEYRIEDVATYDAWRKNQNLVLEFYNKRRSQLATVKPNRAHYALFALEENFDVQIITQNVDDLHERSGSSKILHLHGELTKVRSTLDENLVYNIGYKEINTGDNCEKGAQLRPHIVWFGEAVPLIEVAAEMVMEADILMVIGTSLLVYPAAGLLHYASPQCKKYLIDPGSLPVAGVPNLTIIKKTAGEGVPELVNKLLAEINN
ncbi:MAG: NAD-dependent protein deacylase [Bacteroidetes bacterium HGW-Bacteroidetes-11]|jgi:NAD-dependent deacetylase|nr:MAG: NAD-dependent protein deacylase [Bacteroidetes bacterium HGW-Bacteroidetes-11]